MHSVTTNVDRVEFRIEAEEKRPNRLLEWAWRKRFFLTVVMLPTLIVGLYYAVIAAPQYQSEAHLLVRSAAGGSGGSSGLSQMMSFMGGGKSQGSAAELADYLLSMDAVRSLRANADLVGRFRRPEADFLAKLPTAQPTPEALLKYYRRHVEVLVDVETGIATLRVRSFRPQDSYALINALLTLGEQRVNALNRRANEATVGVSERSVAGAEEYARQIGRQLDNFRSGVSDIDPQGTGEVQMKLVGELNSQLAMTRAQLQSVISTIGTNNPQYDALRARVSSLSAQVAAQDNRLVGGRGSIAAGLGGYQELKLREDFASKRYEAAAGTLEKARDEALRQQLFVARLVEPNLPVKSTYPKGLKNTATVFLGLTLLFGIGWLLLAGVREHAA